MTDHLDVEIRFEADPERRGPGRLRGVLLRYGEISGDRPERFTEGALSWPDDGIVLVRQHDRQSPITRFTPIRDGRDLLVDVALPDTSAGRDAATEVRSGLLRGLSVEFRPLADAFVGGLREIRRGVLVRAGLVDSPSYTGSLVEVRHRRGRRLWL